MIHIQTLCFSTLHVLLGTVTLFFTRQLECCLNICYNFQGICFNLYKFSLGGPESQTKLSHRQKQRLLKRKEKQEKVVSKKKVKQNEV